MKVPCLYIDHLLLPLTSFWNSSSSMIHPLIPYLQQKYFLFPHKYACFIHSFIHKDINFIQLSFNFSKWSLATTSKVDYPLLFLFFYSFYALVLQKTTRDYYKYNVMSQIKFLHHTIRISRNKTNENDKLIIMKITKETPWMKV